MSSGWNIGTGPGTLAQGDDTRFSNGRAPTGAAGGDLAGSYPNPTVSKIGGVAVGNAATKNVGTAAGTLAAGDDARIVGAAQLVAAPATATSAGTAGQIAFDATHVYVCISASAWIRATFAAW